MMKMAIFACAASFAMLAGTVSAASDYEFGQPQGAVSPVLAKAVGKFERMNPGSSAYWTGNSVTTLYGRAFSTGASAQASVDQFLADHIGVLGADAADLVPGSLAGDGAAVRDLMSDGGRPKFKLISYLQVRDGYPVFRGNARFLVRNNAENQLVLVRNGLRNLGNFHVNAAVADNPNMDGAFAAAAAQMPGAQYSELDMVIWAGTETVSTANPALALKFVATVGQPGDSSYDKKLMLADAATGEILYSETMIHNIDVSGNVSGLATPGKKADICETEISKPLPYARVSIGATVAYADINGNFTIPNAGSTAVSVVASPRGRWFRVYSPSADAPTQTLSVTPPGPANFVFNSANTDQTRRAEVNAYLNANIVRDYTLTYCPTYPTIGTQSEFRVNVAVAGTCNAYYDGASINFYSSGGGCANTAYGDVVHHEYGHHLVDRAGSGQGMYGEGMGDVMGVLISDDPILGYGFQNNCAAGIRNANNTVQYPCSGEIHDCGQLISGAVWSTRNALLATNPSTYRAILGDLAVNAMLLHDGTEITPQITIDFLTIDDDNGDITDGTPHYSEINTGFSAHNMPAPAISPLKFIYPTGRPATISPGGGVAFTVQVQASSSQPQPNTGVLYVDPQNDGTYVSYPMNQVSPNLYEANFPATDCTSNVRYYVSAKTTSNSTVSNPTTAPASYYTVVSASSVTTAFSDNFQTNLGWVATVSGATSGQWQRGVPAGDGTRGDPTTDYDGSGQCYLTQNAAGDTDVDGGSVLLTSPTMNATGGDEAFLSYARWYDNSKGADPNNDTFKVEVSNNNGSTWTTLETVGPANQSNGGWYYKTFKLSPVIALTSTMKVRFTASDLASGSVVEAAVDAVKLDTVSCCPADFDGSGFVDFNDYIAFVGAFEAGADIADFDKSGFVDFDDFIKFVEAFELGC